VLTRTEKARRGGRGGQGTYGGGAPCLSPGVIRELIAGLQLSSLHGSSENTRYSRNVWLWHRSAELGNVKSDDAAAAATMG
jgi:hypothetical protein